MSQSYLSKGNERRAILAPVRLSYAHIFEPKAMEGSDKAKYSVSLLVPKDDERTINVLKQAIESAKELGKTKTWGGKVPAGLKLPVRDGDTERDDEVYKGHYFINANSLNAPDVRTVSGQQATDADVYSGCYAAVSVEFYPFNSNGNRGIAVGLGNIKKMKDGERLAGGASAESDFADLTFDEEEAAKELESLF